MPNTYTNLLYHIVYSTKLRKPLIQAEWQDDLYGYMGGIIRDEKGTLLIAGGMPDHVHLLAKLPPTIAGVGYVAADQDKFVQVGRRTRRCALF